VTGEITVFSGSAHPEFAEEMCQILRVELAPARTTRFSNDCLQVQLRANCRQRDVYIVQSLVPPAQETSLSSCSCWTRHAERQQPTSPR
jgi:ribose-phosphate pyrophosphokinase